MTIYNKERKMSELFTVKETAEMFKCHPETIRRYIKQGLLGATRLKGEFRISQEEIDTFLEKGRGR